MLMSRFMVSRAPIVSSKGVVTGFRFLMFASKSDWLMVIDRGIDRRSDRPAAGRKGSGTSVAGLAAAAPTERGTFGGGVGGAAGGTSRPDMPRRVKTSGELKYLRRVVAAIGAAPATAAPAGAINQKQDVKGNWWYVDKDGKVLGPAAH